MVGYIYLRSNEWWKTKQLVKLGETENANDRDPTYITGEPERGTFIKIFEVADSKLVESKLKSWFSEYNYRGTGGSEFFKNCIIDLIETAMDELGIKYKLVTLDETPPPTRTPPTPPITPPKTPTKYESIDTDTFNDRQYQLDIIKVGYEILMILFKFYLELATGGGKSVIVFNIIKKIKPDTIVIFTPRKNINKQNISKKYLSILDDDYNVYDNNSGKCFDSFYKQGKNIIVSCIQSYEKIYEYLNKYKMGDVFIWFDEAHWMVENWINTELTDPQKYILTSENIKYRLFSSASPNTKIVEENENIFGKLIKHINVKDLIKLKYLCPIIPYIFEVKEYNVDYCKTILKDFKLYERHWGLSFHNNCINAFNMFYKHYECYTQGLTDVKPYLLISLTKDILNNERYKNIRLNYNYKDFAKYEEIMNSIAYVVKKCDMGYDFSKIDYISLTDKKMSLADLIQCIGRGLRSDKLGKNKTNLYKQLYLMIPNYIDEYEVDNYDSIISVMQYLQYDIGLEWKDFKFIESSDKKNKIKNSNNEYDGEKVIRSKILEAIKLKKINWTYKKLMIYCKNNNIHSNSEYYKYKEQFPLILPDILPDNFNWCDTYRKHNYYNKTDCIKKIKNIMESNTDLEYMEDHEEILEILNNIDTKIPNVCLWSFYGGSQSEYLVFN
jgi:hypothetical protein